MNKVSIIRIFAIIVLLSLADCISGCIKRRLDIRPRADLQTYECFQYRIYYVLSDNRTVSTLHKGDKVVDRYISIEGITNEVEDMEYIIFPEKIDGIRVDKIYDVVPEHEDGISWSNESTKKIYILATVLNEYRGMWSGGVGFYCYENAEVFCMNKNYLILEDGVNHNKRYIPAYFYYEDYEKYFSIKREQGMSDEDIIEAYNRRKTRLGINFVIIKKYYGVESIGTDENILYANTSYIYNYEDAPNNGYYFIDNYDYNSLITFIPPVPKREGYEFVGWYKESECINEWDFDIDTIGDPTGLDIDLFETKLYAKWEEVDE